MILREAKAVDIPAISRLAIDALTGAARERGATLVATLHQVDMAIARFPRIIGLRDGALSFDLPSAAVTRDVLAKLYAQYEYELSGEDAAQPDASDAAAGRSDLMMCR